MQQCRLLLHLIISASIVDQSDRGQQMNIYLTRFSFPLIAMTWEVLFLYELLKHLKHPYVTLKVKKKKKSSLEPVNLKLYSMTPFSNQTLIFLKVQFKESSSIPQLYFVTFLLIPFGS